MPRLACHMRGGAAMAPAGHCSSPPPVTHTQALRELIGWPSLYANEARQLGVRWPRGLLLHGPPGCGKTLMVQAVAGVVGVGVGLVVVVGGGSGAAALIPVHRACCVISFPEEDPGSAVLHTAAAACQRVRSSAACRLGGATYTCVYAFNRSFLF